MAYEELQNAIEQANAKLAQGDANAVKNAADAVHQTIELVDTGKIRVAEKVDDAWKVNAWIKTAILLRCDKTV